MRNLILAGETFVWPLIYLAAGLTLVACVTWTRRRKAKPGYAPLWAWALVGTVIAAFAVLALARMAVGLEPGRTGSHRKPRRAVLSPRAGESR